MTNNERDALDAASRISLHVFAERSFEIVYPGQVFERAPYLELVDDRLTKIEKGATRRQVINLPPRSLKSYFATVCFAAWMIGRNPKLNIMIACHTTALAIAHFNNIRKLMKSEMYRHIFPASRIGAGKDTEAEVETNAGGRILAVSFEAAPTGRGADGIIIDDPLKADDAWSPESLEACERFYRDALLSRLNHPRDSFVLIVMQRLAAQDLVGRLSKEEGFDILSLPLQAVDRESIPYGQNNLFVRDIGDVLNPTRMTREDCESLKAERTEAVFAAQFQQTPLINGGVIIRKSWFTYIDSPMKDGRIVSSWDTAASRSSKADFSVCTTWRVSGKKFELMDVFRERLDVDSLVDHAKLLVARFKPDKVLVEEAGSGFALGPILKAINGLSVTPVRPIHRKEQRLEQCLVAFREGMVLLPGTASWLKDYIDELLAFPSGRYDDQVDATTLFLNWMLERVLGDIDDPRFRLHEPVIAGVTGAPARMMRVGAGFHRLGQPINIRTPPKFRR